MAFSHIYFFWTFLGGVAANKLCHTSSTELVNINGVQQMLLLRMCWILFWLVTPFEKTWFFSNPGFCGDALATWSLYRASTMSKRRLFVLCPKTTDKYL